MSVTEETTRTAPATTQRIPSPLRLRLAAPGGMRETRRDAAEARDATESDTGQESVWESEGGTSPAPGDSGSESMDVQPGATARR
jgi:hypothetical protein